MQLHRIALAPYSRTAAEAFSGRGGLVGKGRWHTPGRLIVYTAQHLSLSMAEALVHIQRSNHIAPYNRWVIDIPDRQIAPCPSVPVGWKIDQSITQAIGDAWLSAGSSVAMVVPSAIVPEEMNCLVNPAHPTFSLVWVKSGPHPFIFDPRLTRS
jgi:RES domain-containing protein